MEEEYTDESLNNYIASYGEEKDKEIDVDFINKLLMFERNIDNLTMDGKCCVFYNLSLALSLDHIDGHDQDLSNAILYDEKAENIAKVISNDWTDKYYREYLYNRGHLYSRIKANKKAEEIFSEYIYLKHKDDKDIAIFTDKRAIYYGFHSVDIHVIRDLKMGNISLRDPTCFNDPFDTLLFHYIDYRQKKILKNAEYNIQPFRDAYKHIKVGCFAKDKVIKGKIDENNRAFKNILMWSHYANSHKGICIRYKFNLVAIKSFKTQNTFTNLFEVKYERNVGFDEKIPVTTRKLFATKQEDWDYENEVRILHFDPENNDEFLQISLEKIKGKIEAIFFGYRCSDKDKELIKTLLADKGIEFFDFITDPEKIHRDIYNLKLEDEERFARMEEKSLAENQIHNTLG